jgi:hypothetical protein
MEQSIGMNTKNTKNKGRPKTGQILARSVRIDEHIWARLDDWRREQVDLPSRNEALGRFLDENLPFRIKK